MGESEFSGHWDISLDTLDVFVSKIFQEAELIDQFI